MPSWLASLRRGFLKVKARWFSAHLKKNVLLLSVKSAPAHTHTHITEDDWPCFCSISLCISLLFSFPLYIKSNFFSKIRNWAWRPETQSQPFWKACTFVQAACGFFQRVFGSVHQWLQQLLESQVWYYMDILWWQEMTRETCPPFHISHLYPKPSKVAALDCS